MCCLKIKREAALTSRGMYEGRSGDGAGPGPAAHSSSGQQSPAVERLSRAGPRRSRLQRQLEVHEEEAPERGTLTPALRRKHLKELLLNSGLNSALSTQQQQSADSDPADWALYPMEHAWMLSAAEGNYDTMMELLCSDPQLLTRRDFISGFSALHWLAKRGEHETLLRLLRYVESVGVVVNVNVRGSGGLTPLHLASMHRHYMVVKLLVGAFSADVDAMDYSGRRPWQYLEKDAPLEMRELLGTWDDEHRGGVTQIAENRNGNNNCACASVEGSVEDCAEDAEGKDEVDSSVLNRRGGWRFGSLKKFIPSFSFLGNKN